MKKNLKEMQVQNYRVPRHIAFNIMTRGEQHKWMAWIGPVEGHSINDSEGQEDIYLSHRLPPFDQDVAFSEIKVGSNGIVLCTLLVEGVIEDVLNSDTTLLDPIVRSCVTGKLLPKSVLLPLGEVGAKSANLTPTKSPLKKKLRPSASVAAPLCRAALFGGIPDDEDVSWDTLSINSSSTTTDQRKAVSNVQKLLPKVSVTNLPTPFFQDHFLYCLNVEVCKVIGKNYEECAVSCSVDGDKTAIVEFRSVDEATKACQRDGLWCYEGKFVEMQQRAETEAEFPYEAVEMSHKVKIRPLTNPLFKDHLLHFLNNFLWKASMVMTGDISAHSCSDLDGDTVVVEFRDSAEASLACFLENVIYGETLLIMEQLPACRAANVSNENPLQSAGTIINDTSPSTGNPLNSDKETKAFLDQCVALTTGQRFIGSTTAFEKVCAHFQKKNILITVEDCKSRLKRLYAQYRNSPTCKWRSYMAFIRGEPNAIRPPSTEEDGVYQTDVDDIDVFLGRNKSTQGFSWDADKGAPTLMLIDILITRKEEYMSVHKDLLFGGSVADIMVTGDHDVTPDMCKARTKTLEGQYRMYNANRKRTGAGHVKWPYFEPLEALLGDNVSTEPYKTYSAGPVCAASVNSALQSESASGRVGRSRTSAGRQERLQVLRELASARNNMTEQLKDMKEVIQMQKLNVT